MQSMKKALLQFRLGSAVCALLALSGCEKEYVYRYRITMSVRDHGVVRKASNVVEVTQPVDSEGREHPPDICGEAIGIALSNGKVVAAILEGAPRPGDSEHAAWRSAPGGILIQHLGLPTDWKSFAASLAKLGTMTTGTVVLDQFEYPELVAFAVPADPTSAKEVNLDAPQSTLGEGVEVPIITIAPTQDPVTRGDIRHVLPWVPRWMLLHSVDENIDGTRFGTIVRYRLSWFKHC